MCGSSSSDSDNKIFKTLLTWKPLLHSSDLDELLEQSGSLHQVFAEAKLGHHPVLHLIEATHKPLQVGRDGAGELVAAKYVVDELHLGMRRHGHRRRLHTLT